MENRFHSTTSKKTLRAICEKADCWRSYRGVAFALFIFAFILAVAVLTALLMLPITGLKYFVSVFLSVIIAMAILLAVTILTNGIYAFAKPYAFITNNVINFEDDQKELFVVYRRKCFIPRRRTYNQFCYHIPYNKISKYTYNDENHIFTIFGEGAVEKFDEKTKFRYEKEIEPYTSKNQFTFIFDDTEDELAKLTEKLDSVIVKKEQAVVSST